jgi:hypothetical protein
MTLEDTELDPLPEILKFRSDTRTATVFRDVVADNDEHSKSKPPGPSVAYQQAGALLHQVKPVVFDNRPASLFGDPTTARAAQRIPSNPIDREIEDRADTRMQPSQFGFVKAALEYAILHAFACAFQNLRDPVPALIIRNVVGDDPGVKGRPGREGTFRSHRIRKGS